ncbi:MAG: hypothetical protein EBX37_04360 [Alphaproteobacteria bacterium]|nr:hypothetical protein [Alphaproteobacteria bacterium]
MAAPSLHLNVSLWREKDGKAINCFASDIPGAATKKGEVFEMAPPPLAMRCMRAMTVLQKDGLALLSEPTNYNFALRHVQGYLAPKWIYHAPGKQMEYAVCYRSQPGDPHFARIENRAPSARSDPYLAMTMTMGAMYMAVCRKQFAAWEKRSEWAPADMNQYRPEQMAGSEPLLEVLGLPLYREALMYYGVDGRDVPRRAAGMRRA